MAEEDAETTTEETVAAEALNATHLEVAETAETEETAEIQEETDLHLEEKTVKALQETESREEAINFF